METRVMERPLSITDVPADPDTTEVVLIRLWDEAIRRVEAEQQQQEEERRQAERRAKAKALRDRVRFSYD